MATFQGIGLLPEWNAPRLEEMRTVAPITVRYTAFQVSQASQNVLWTNRLIAPVAQGPVTILADAKLITRNRASGQGWPS